MQHFHRRSSLWRTVEVTPLSSRREQLYSAASLRVNTHDILLQTVDPLRFWKTSWNDNLYPGYLMTRAMLCSFVRVILARLVLSDELVEGFLVMIWYIGAGTDSPLRGTFLRTKSLPSAYVICMGDIQLRTIQTSEIEMTTMNISCRLLAYQVHG